MLDWQEGHLLNGSKGFFGVGLCSIKRVVVGLPKVVEVVVDGVQASRAAFWCPLHTSPRLPSIHQGVSVFKITGSGVEQVL